MALPAVAIALALCTVGVLALIIARRPSPERRVVRRWASSKGLKLVALKSHPIAASPLSPWNGKSRGDVYRASLIGLDGHSQHAWVTLHENTIVVLWEDARGQQVVPLPD